MYLTPAGKTAALLPDFLERPQEEYKFDLAIILCSTELKVDILKKCTNWNAILVEMNNPYHGSTDYIQVLKRLVTTTLLYTGKNITELIVNTSGGTEKMSSLVRDAQHILERDYPTRHVFGIYNNVIKDVIFTTCPSIPSVAILTEITREVDETLELRKDVDHATRLDQYE